MGRIPEEELERIKRTTDLAALVRARGIELVARGADLVGRCPWHDDHEPSLIVSPRSNLWHCLGACNQGGSVIDWVMKAEGVSFRHAVEILRETGGSATVRPTAAPPAAVKHSTVPKLASPVEVSAEDHELLLQVVGYYHATLQAPPEALAYLASRCIEAPEAVSHFQLGFANRTLGLRLPEKNRVDGARIRHRLTQLGILRASGHEHFNGCLVVPVLDEQGRVVELYGRKIVHHLRSDCPSHLYLPGPHRGVFNLDALRCPEVILCEALIDALTFYCAGFPNVTSAYGVHGFTPEMLEAMKAHGTERVLIAYDRDAAGDTAAQALAAKLAGEGITSFRVRFPHGLDANAYACKVKPAHQALAALLRGAEHMAGPVVTGHAVRDARSATAPAAEPAQETSAEPLSSLAVVSEAAEATEPIDISDLVEDALPAAGNGPHASPPATSDPLPATASASPIPPAPRLNIPADVTEQQVVLRFGERRWRVRGLSKNLSFETLRVNLFVGLEGQPERFHQDTVDLYAAKQRQVFIRTAAAELGINEDTVKHDLGTVLLKLEELQEAEIKRSLEPKAKTVTIDEPDRQAALELLRDPLLLDRILADFERCGVVGERTNVLVGYLAAVSRKLDRPLAVLIQSSSAAGKSALMTAILAMVPEEERVAYSAMTGQSLFYMGEADLAHKILAIAEEEGAERASYALKLLQSEGELSIASTGKDPSTGRLVTHEYRVQGPVGIFLTTTAIDLDEELLNRCLVLSVDEDREQTRAIHRRQREAETLEGYLAELDREEVVTLHRNAQRLLRPIRVVNPYARKLTFLDDKTRTRRDHLKYLALIRAIALLHQHQRPVRTSLHRGAPRPFIEVTLADISTANRLAHEVLGRTLDELPPQTRRFLLSLDAMVAEACKTKAIGRSEHRFSRAEARQHTGWSLTQVKAHLDRLLEMEYVVLHRGSRGQSFVYELLYSGQGQEGEPFLMGLLDVGSLGATQAHAYDPDLSASEAGVSDPKTGVSDPEAELSGSKRGQNGAKSAGCRSASEPEEANGDGHSPEIEPTSPANARPWSPKPPAPYVPERRTGSLLSLAAASNRGRR